MTVLLLLWSGGWSITGSTLLIIAAHLVYNVEPERLKRRGFAGAGVFGLSLTTLALPAVVRRCAARTAFFWATRSPCSTLRPTGTCRVRYACVTERCRWSWSVTCCS
jgi:hypothetical protein